MPMLLRYMDQLDPERLEVFEKLAAFSSSFVLAGGTAIMFQIGHRKSYDFDCFSLGTLPDNLIRKVRSVFGPKIYPEYRTSEQLTFKTGKGISLTFVYHPYKHVRKPIKTSSISVFHLDDLVANKAYTIGRRAAWRDYVDIFFFLKWKLYDIGKIISLTQKKFGNEFNEKLFFEQLVYFSDLEITPSVFIKESYTPDEIQSFFSKTVADYLKKVLG